ncbi:MAG: hypothetical protein GX203_06040 [Acholeplasmataceae bacterium]|nr:hypothetical protein [Acholeplasmataceae bacterium]
MIIKEAILENEINKVKLFLKDVGLNYDRDINYTVYIEENDEIIGTISAAQNKKSALQLILNIKDKI